MQHMLYRLITSFFIASLSLALFVSVAYSAELTITPDQSGSEHSYTLKVDHVEKLAGLKVTLSYPGILQYNSAKKCQEFKSFLHVVNDKVPEKIIVVMARAQGVSGDDLPVFTLYFKSSEKEPPQEAPHLKIIGCELMSDTLIEIPCGTPGDS